jgi:hypothetical protein
MIPEVASLTWRSVALSVCILLSPLLVSCGQVTDDPFIPEVDGNYGFRMSYGGNCSSTANPGTCEVSPVVVLQNQGTLVVQPLGAGRVEDVVVVFGSENINICDLSAVTLTFSGIFDGSDIAGSFVGTMRRTGFGECTIQNGEFTLDRIP